MLDALKVKAGVAPINWSNDDLPELGAEISLERCLDEMKEAGYDGCEVGIKYPKDPEILKPMLEARGLVVCNQWANYRLSIEPFNVVRDEFIDLLEFLSAMGSRIVGGGEVGTSIQGNFNTSLYDDKPHNSAEQWRMLCEGLNALGKIAKEEYGIKLCFHHHMGTCVQTMEEVERLMNETDPRFVWLNYDCGHFYASDENPATAMRTFASRVGHVHLKDVRKEVKQEVKTRKLSFLHGVLKGFFTVPGDGDIGLETYKQIFKELENVSYEGWLVLEAEQDPARAPPLEYAIRGRTFMRKHAGI